MSSLSDLGKALGVGVTLGTGRGRKALRLGGRAGLFLAKRHPVGFTLSTLATLGYLHRDEIPDIARRIAQSIPAPVSGQGGRPKRALSKANKAMKKAMKATKNNFKQATKIASKANPSTKSKIGKGSTKVKKLARKIRKSVWGSLKRIKK